MSAHEYICPKCGVTLQSGQDVAGRKVRCLGCMTVFVAGGDRRAPTTSSTRSGRTSAEAFGQYVPPLPKSRNMPVAAFVICGMLALVIGLTIFLGIKYKNRQDDSDSKTIVQRSTPKKAPPATKALIANAKPTLPPPPPLPPSPTQEEEEEPPITPAVNPSPTRKPPAKKDDFKIPDIGSLLPKLPGPTLPAAKKDDSATTPPSAKPVEPKAGRSDPPITVVDGQIPPALLKKLKAATVFIKVRAGLIAGSGSGFVLRVDGDKALIVTNDHVAEPKNKQGIHTRNAQLEVVFHSSRSNEFSRKAELIAADEDHDLAILRVTGVRSATNFPEPLSTSERFALSETMPVYIFGFPFGEMLSTTRGNPAVTIGKGTISSLREDDAGDPAFIQIDGDVNPGNSGGPIVDSRGRLVGVTVAKLLGTNIGMAIPPVELSRVLMGRVGNLDFRVKRVVRNTVEMDVLGSLIDPLDRVKSASLRVVRADNLKHKPTVGSNGKWSALGGSDKTELKISGRAVSGRVELPLRLARSWRVRHFVSARLQGPGRQYALLRARITETSNYRQGFGPIAPGDSRRRWPRRWKAGRSSTASQLAVIPTGRNASNAANGRRSGRWFPAGRSATSGTRIAQAHGSFCPADQRDLIAAVVVPNFGHERAH